MELKKTDLHVKLGSKKANIKINLYISAIYIIQIGSHRPANEKTNQEEMRLVIG
jgi:hypothetical protein